MTARRALIERVGLFDEDFGPGSVMDSGEDADYLFRTYLAGITLEHVPDMTVFHHHGRKTSADGFELYRRYLIGSGALSAKYLFKHANLSRPFVWDFKHAVREIITGSNYCFPTIGFSYRHSVAYAAQGAVRYLLRSRKSPANRGRTFACEKVEVDGL
jgi:GT2 family glycosyltransferase